MTGGGGLKNGKLSITKRVNDPLQVTGSWSK